MTNPVGGSKLTKMISILILSIAIVMFFTIGQCRLRSLRPYTTSGPHAAKGHRQQVGLSLKAVAMASSMRSSRNAAEGIERPQRRF